MPMKGYSLNVKPLEILSSEQVEKIHEMTLEILEDTGIRIEHDRALKIFADNGCKVDFKNKRVRIPGYLAEECIFSTCSLLSISRGFTLREYPFIGIF